MNDKLKLAGIFLAGLAVGFSAAYLMSRYEIVYLGLDGIGYHDFQVKASFFREFPW